MMFISKFKSNPIVRNYFIFITFIIAISLFTLFLLLHIERKTRINAGEKLKTVLDSTHTSLHLWLDQRFTNIQELSSDKLIVDITKELLKNSYNKDLLINHSGQKELRNYLILSIKQSDDLGYYIISGDSLSLASMSDKNIGIKNIIATYYPGLLNRAFDGEPVLIPPFESEVTLPDKDDRLIKNYPVMFIASPVKDENDSVIAVFTIQLNPLKSFSEITQMAQVGATGESYAIDNNGRLITNIRFEDQLRKTGIIREDQNAILNVRILDPGGNLLEGHKYKKPYHELPYTFMAKELIQGKSGVNIKGYRDYRGVEVIGAWMWDKTLHIGMVTEVDLREAKEPYYDKRKIILGLFIFSILTSYIHLVFTIRYKKKKISQAQLYQNELEEQLNKRTKTLKTINQKLKENERNLKLALKGADAGMFSFHLQSGIVIWDNRSIQLHELKKREFENDLQSALLYVKKEDQLKLLEVLKEIQNDRKDDIEITYQVQRDNNKTKYIHTIGKIEQDREGNTLYVNGTHTDITEKVNAERALLESEMRFRSLHNIMKQGVLIVSRDGIIKSLNPAAEKILEINSDDIKNKNFKYVEWNFVDNQDNPLDINDMPLSISIKGNKEIRNVILKYVQPESFKKKWLSVTTIPLFERDNERPYEFYTILEDITKRKVILEELRKSEEKYRYLVDSSLIGIFQTTINCDIVYANKAYSHIFEYSSPIEMFNKTGQMTFKNAREKSRFIKILKEKEEINSEEFEMISNTGKVKQIIINARLKDDYISGMLQDITVKKESEESLKRSEENFRNIVQFSPLAMIVFDEKNKVVQFNNEFQELFGYNKKEIKNINDWWQLAYPEANYRKEIKDEFKRRKNLFLLESSEFKSLETRVICKNGKELWVDLNFVVMSDSMLNLFVFIDLTERKRIEEALTSALLLNQSMTNYTVEEIIDVALEEGVRLTDSEIGFFHFVNDDQNTISLQTWSKQTLEKCKVPDKKVHYPIQEAGMWVDCIKARMPVIHNDYQNMKGKKGLPDGHFPLYRELVVPIFEGEQIVAVIGVGNKIDNYNQFDSDQLSLMADNIWNIVRKKRMEEDLLKAKEEAERANKAKSIFLANMSHEIRTPMNAVLGFADILDEELNDPVQLNYLKSIKSSGKTLLGLINDVLDLSKIEAGKMEINNEFMDLNELLTEIKQIFTLKVDVKNKQFIISEEHCIGFVFLLDELKLRQILLNIVGNAVKFTESGHIKITTRTTDINIEKKTCRLILEIEDTGIGIPEEYRDLIFDSFRQQEEQDVRKYGGTGLGLTITKRLIDMMDGIIEVESELGKGSLFRVIFNEVEYGEKEISESKEEEFDAYTIKFKKAKVLVVDDVESNRELIKGYFRDSEVIVDEAENGQQALIHIQQKKPDVILMDIRMPVMDGYELTRRIKEMDKLKDIPVIAVTASVMETSKAKMRAHDFSNYLRKPIKMNELYQVLIKYIPHDIVAQEKEEEQDMDTHELPGELKSLLYGRLLKLWNEVKNADNMEEIALFGQELHMLGQHFMQKSIEKYGKELISYSHMFDVESTKKLLSSYKELIDNLSDYAYK